MKIPLAISKDNLITVSFTIRAAHIFGAIEAIVDTGSPETIISEADAIRLNIPISRLKFASHSYGIGGSPIAKYELRNVTLSFRTDENKAETIKLDKVYVSRRTSKDARTTDIALGVPSIIGNDFLLKQKFVLYFNPNKNVAYLERE